MIIVISLFCENWTPRFQSLYFRFDSFYNFLSQSPQQKGPCTFLVCNVVVGFVLFVVRLGTRDFMLAPDIRHDVDRSRRVARSIVCT